jgi:hypothetical protein
MINPTKEDIGRKVRYRSHRFISDPAELVALDKDLPTMYVWIKYVEHEKPKRTLCENLEFMAQ